MRWKRIPRPPRVTRPGENVRSTYFYESVETPHRTTEKDNVLIYGSLQYGMGLASFVHRVPSTEPEVSLSLYSSALPHMYWMVSKVDMEPSPSLMTLAKRSMMPGC